MPWWDPYEEIRELERRVNRMFRDFWRRGPKMLGPGEGIMPYEGEVVEPCTDICETDKEIILRAEMPGVDRGDININATENSIEITAETKREEKEEKEGYIRRERRYGKFYRSYSLPTSVDPDKAKAKYKNGILEVRLPKKEVKKGRVIEIE
jgi:HSP20 family protein